MTSNPDVIVIGAGGGGPVVAKELTERGVRVLMLEAGPWLDPDEDFSLLEDDMGGIVFGRLRWGPEDRARPAWTRRSDGVGLCLQVAGVGGTTLHYNGISPRPFATAVDDRWPFGYDELIPWLERVEDFLPVRMVDDLATKDALFALGCEKSGLVRSESADITSFDAVWRPCRNAILPIARMPAGVDLVYPAVDGCTMCGKCLQGCPHPVGAPLERKAKRATNVSYVPSAVATGNCEVVPNAFATAVLFENGSNRARARGVRWRDTSTGEGHEAEASVVVMAGGSVENPRLWFNSGLPNSHDAVGRRLTTHLQDFVTGFFDREVNPDVGQVTMARADFPGNGTMFVQGFGPQSFSAVITGTGAGFWEDAPEDEPWDIAGRKFGEDAVRMIREYHRSLSITICTDDEASPDNRVTLAEDWPADEHGPVPKVRYHPTPGSRERENFLCRRAAEILRAAGAHTVHRTDIPGFLTHIMGTMRMGMDPAVSVVGASGEAHEVERLFVADSSVAPSDGGANPTLTAQALAARTADRIAAAYFS
ncbi:MAG: GMC oxidoreductase [Actinomycetota bacterium]